MKEGMRRMITYEDVHVGVRSNIVKGSELDSVEELKGVYDEVRAGIGSSPAATAKLQSDNKLVAVGEDLAENSSPKEATS